MKSITESGLRVLIAIKRRVGQNGRCFAGQILVRRKPFRKRKSVFVNFYTGET